MISGFPFPSGDVNYTYPPEYQKELGPYLLDYLGESLFTRTQTKMLEGIQERQEDRFRVADQWIKSGKYDFIWMVFTASDKVQHFFWKDMDPNHPEHTKKGQKEFGNAILGVWERLDVMFGDLVAALPPDATVLVMSDHGFGPIYRQVNMKNWVDDTDIPDWLKTHAVPPMLVTNGLMHYFLEGGLKGSSDRQAFIDKFEDLAKNLRDPETGVCPFRHIYRREEIYHGPMLEKAPDVIIEDAPKYYITWGVPDSVQTNVPYFQDIWTSSFTAYHLPQGVIAVRGPNVHRNTEGDIQDRLASGGDIKDAKIIDVTPSLLALMGQVLPEQMDGRVWNEVIKADFLKKHPVTRKEVPGFLLDRAPVENLTPEQKEQMRALPYIQ
jgi:predicted AlkP superfamily phosphohydrolase/phosphomutase